MANFPRSYTLFRRGRTRTVIVQDMAGLLDLRTELELIRRFGAGVSRRVIAALDARLTGLEFSPDACGARDDLADMRSILVDSLAPANTRAATCIDADFPQIMGALNMSAIKKEADKFHRDVAEQIKSADLPDAGALAEAFTDATAPAGQTAAAEPGATDGSDEAFADILKELAAEAGPIEESVEPVAAALIQAETDLDAIAAGFEQTACDLANLTEDVRGQVGDRGSTARPDHATDDTGDADCSAVEQGRETAAEAADDARFEALLRATEPGPDEPDMQVAASTDARSAQPSSEHALPMAGLRSQLDEVKDRLVSQIDRLAELLGEVAQAQVQAARMQSVAAAFQETVQRAEEASRQFTTAQAQAEDARSAYEQAEARLLEARRAWEAAQRAAAAAAQRVQQSSSTPPACEA